MDKNQLRGQIYNIFSNRNMLIISLVAIPILLGLFIYPDNPTLLALDWLIWLAFLLEFALKLYLEDNKDAYIEANKLDSGISVVIIVSPLLSLFTSNLLPLPVFGVIRALLRAIRSVAYVNKAGIKSQQPQNPGYVHRESAE